MEGASEQATPAAAAAASSSHPELDRARRASLRSQHMHLHQEGTSGPVHKGGASTDAFHRHRADSLLKLLGRKPGDKDPDEQQKLHHLVCCGPCPELRALYPTIRAPCPGTELTAPARLWCCARQKNRKVFQPTSLCCLKLDNPVRKFCIDVARNKWFDRVVVGVIILNCIVLSLMDPLDTDGTTLRTKIVEKSELWFTVAFTIELAVKVVAMGLIGKGSYLSDRWNWLDCIVVIVGCVAALPPLSLRPPPIHSLPGSPDRCWACLQVCLYGAWCRQRVVAAHVPCPATAAHAEHDPGDGRHREVDAGVHPCSVQRLPPVRLHILHLWHYRPATVGRRPAWSLRVHAPNQ